MVPWNSALGWFAYNWQSKWVGIISIKTERTQIYFLSDVLVAVASPRIDAAFFWLGALFSISLGTAVIPRRNEKQMNYAKFGGSNKVHYGRCAKVWNVTRLHPLTRWGALPRAPQTTVPLGKARGISEISNRNFAEWKAPLVNETFPSYNVKNSAGNARLCHPNGQNSSSFHPGNKAEAFIWQNFQPA